MSRFRPNLELSFVGGRRNIQKWGASKENGVWVEIRDNIEPRKIRWQRDSIGYATTGS